MEMELKVKGMMCTGCENRLKNAVCEIDGVERAEASFETGLVKVYFNKDIDKSIIKETIEDIGFEVE